MKKALFTGIILRPLEDVDARIFMMDPPLDGHTYVRVSVKTFWSTLYASDSFKIQPETYIFSCDASGEISNYAELEGSYRGGTSHAQALLNAGYEIQELPAGSENEEDLDMQDR